MSDPAHILIVDDEALSRDILTRRLGAKGFSVESCDGGSSCFSAIQNRMPDLILLDVYMPQMSGMQVLEQLRKSWSADLLPIILVTAMVDSEDVVAGFAAGANDYVVKPVNLPVLLARIETCLKIKKLAESSARAKELAQANAQLAAEIGERKRVEQALRLSEERFEKAFRSHMDGLAISDRETGKIIDVNDNFGRMFGYARQELMGRSGLELGIIADPADRDRAIVELKRDGVLRDFEALARRRDGEMFPVAVGAEMLQIAGKPAVLMIVRDITERQRAREAMRLANEKLEQRVAERTADLQTANEALRESEERFRTMADSSPMLLWIDAPDGSCQFLNKSWLKFTGRTLEQELGFGWLGSIHPDDRAHCAKAFDEARRRREPMETEYRLRRYDGEYRWILDTSMPRYTPGGDFIGLIGSCIDITERRNAADMLRRANNALRESEERFRTMADHAPVLLWMTGPDGMCSFVNRSWTDFTGRTLVQEQCFGWTDGLHPDDRERTLAAWQKAFTNREKFLQDYRIRRHDGEYRWLYGTGVPRFTPDGFAGYIGSCVDVTERRDAEQFLRQTADELERRVHDRTAELAQSNALLIEEVAERRAAHQRLLASQGKLRALTSQVAIAEERERRRIARGLHDEIGQSLALVKMRLGAFHEMVASDVEKSKNLEEIRSALEKAIVHIRSLTFELGSRILYEFGLETAIENLVEDMHKHGLEPFFADDRQPKPLDEEMRVIVFQAVRELLHNVAKHARAKHVAVSISREDSFVKVGVRDDGVGFDPQKTGHAVTSTGGFGLFSIREQMDYVGGRVEIDSLAGRGTQTTIYAPLRQNGQQKAADAAAAMAVEGKS
ncbi:MAG TPA: PAS domain S-box protein [Tepidisphaeraceae bacterium]|jgi:PAS domain S-box-containing protein